MSLTSTRTYTVYWNEEDVVVLKAEAKKLWDDFHGRAPFVSQAIIDAMTKRLNLLESAISSLRTRPSDPKIGRPLKLNELITLRNPITQETRTLTRGQRVVELIENGSSKDSASRMAGIGESTLLEYLARGRADKQKGLETEFTAFLDSTTCALDEFEDRSLNLMQTAALNDWRAQWELLQARLPEKWGKRTRITVETARVEAAEVAVIAFTDALQEHLADPELRLRILESALNRLAPGDGAQKALGAGSAIEA